MDGDGRQDLVSETAEEVLFHLADPQLSTSPTWRIDLRALRAQMPRRDGLDLDDLFSNFDGGIDWAAALIATLKIGYDGTLMFEVAAGDSAHTVLHRTRHVRTRFEELVV